MTCTALCGHSAVCHTTQTPASYFRGRELVLKPLPRPSRALRRKPSRQCAHASAFAGALAAPSSDPVGSIRGLINMASAAALIVAAWWYLSTAQVCFSCLAHRLAVCVACLHVSSACRLTTCAPHHLGPVHACHTCHLIVWWSPKHMSAENKEQGLQLHSCTPAPPVYIPVGAASANLYKSTSWSLT